MLKVNCAGCKIGPTLSDPEAGKALQRERECGRGGVGGRDGEARRSKKSVCGEMIENEHDRQRRGVHVSSQGGKWWLGRWCRRWYRRWWWQGRWW